jgi:glycosyltransferase involved in cell wall biosynthesis
MPDTENSRAGHRVLAALNGLELFGHERGNIEVFKVLREMGAEVMVGVNASECGGEVALHLQQLGFVTFTLPFSNQWSRQWLTQHPSSIYEKVKAVVACSWVFHEAIRKFRPSHIHLGSSLVYSYVSLALALCKVPLVYRMGDCPPVDSPFNLRIWRMAMMRASQVVAVSEFVRESASRAGVRNISVIHNLAPSRPISASEDAHAPNDGTINLLYVGAVAEHKGLMPLLEALSRLAPGIAELRLDIVGGSQYDTQFRNQLKQLVSSRQLDNRVRFCGQVDDPASFYARAAVHVAPSICEEALGNVVLESKREGTPSVIFPSGGLPEMVRHGVDGYTCREKSVDALEEGLRWMLADMDRLKRMGVAAREDSEARFGSERFTKQWCDIYRSVIDSCL